MTRRVALGGKCFKLESNLRDPAGCPSGLKPMLLRLKRWHAIWAHLRRELHQNIDSP
jgi:hypothetical protein